MAAAKAFTQPELNRILALHEKRGQVPSRVKSELKHTRLDGLNMANRDLAGLDFTGASLVGAMLFGSNLAKARLFGADLRRADLRNADLTGADMRGACLNHANLCYAKLDNADLRTVVMMRTDANGMRIMDSADRLQGGRGSEVGVDFSSCSMKGVSFNNAELEGADFTGALMQGACFQDARLVKPVFKGAVLTGVNLAEIIVPPGALDDCILDIQKKAVDRVPVLEAAIDRHQAWVVSNGKEGAPALLDSEDLRPLRASLRGRQLTALSARGVQAIGVDFSYCQLQGAKFEGADLREANFAGADLSGASFAGAKLAHAVFDRAKIAPLVLLSGEIVRPDFRGAEMNETQLKSAQVETVAA